LAPTKKKKADSGGVLPSTARLQADLSRRKTGGLTIEKKMQVVHGGGGKKGPDGSNRLNGGTKRVGVKIVPPFNAMSMR